MFGDTFGVAHSSYLICKGGGAITAGDVARLWYLKDILLITKLPASIWDLSYFGVWCDYKLDNLRKHQPTRNSYRGDILFISTQEKRLQ